MNDWMNDRRCDLVFGQSASGKTSWALRVAAALYAAKGLKTRWYLGDGGGETLTNSGVADFVQIVEYPLWSHPFQTTTKVVEGWWPENPADHKSRWVQDGFPGIGMFVFEGLTVMSDYLMGNKEGGLAYRMGRGETLNKDDSFKIKDGDLILGGNARTHFGMVQRRIQELVEISRVQLPGIKLWTAHERRAEDPDYKDVMFGPDVVGQVLTTKIGACFGNTVHLVAVPLKKKEVDPRTQKSIEKLSMEYRAYTRKHFDPEGQTFAKFYANTRLPSPLAEQDPTFLPEYVAPADPLRYYALLDQARLKNRDLLLTGTAA